MVAQWGLNQQVWEAEISKCLLLEVKLPNFFWEVEMPIAAQRIPENLTCLCHSLEGWFEIYYEENLSAGFERYAIEKLTSGLARAA